ncbi:uncharacterized protein LOC113078290, partial [Tachysurus ichikawai]
YRRDKININAYSSTPAHSDTVPAGPLSPTYEPLHVTVKLHRVNLLEELITQFKDEVIMSYSVKYSFIHEMGPDADGVSRDVYAAFWTEFLDCAAEGADVRVPSLSPKWQEEEWTGSDVICVEDIQVIFTPLEGLSRRPIAHTCGPTLELPSTYNSYPDLRAKMEATVYCPATSMQWTLHRSVSLTHMYTLFPLAQL